MTIPDHIREALLRVFEHTYEEESGKYDALPADQRAGHLYESLAVLREWLGPVQVTDREYTIGAYADGDYDDIAVFWEGEPLALLIATRATVEPLVHAGNCHHDLLDALEEILRCRKSDTAQDAIDWAWRNAERAARKAQGGCHG